MGKILFISFFYFCLFQETIKANPIDSVLWNKIRECILANEKKNTEKRFYFDFEVSPDGMAMLKEYINASNNSKEILTIENKKTEINNLLARYNSYNASNSNDLRFYVFHGRYFLGLSTYEKNTLGKSPTPLKTMIEIFHRDNRNVTLKNKNLWAVNKESFRTLKTDPDMKNKRIFILFFVEKFELVYEKQVNQNQKAKLKKVYEVFWKEEGLEEHEKMAAKKADFIAKTHIVQNQTDTERAHSAEKIVKEYMEAFDYAYKSEVLACPKEEKDWIPVGHLPKGILEKNNIEQKLNSGNKKNICSYLGHTTEKVIKSILNENYINNASIIHLISHGSQGIGSSPPPHCGISYSIITGELFNDKCISSQENDGRLEYSEITKLRLGNPKLCFLNICSVGTGAFSMMNAFLKNKVESVIAPYERIQDDKGFLFAKRFYDLYLKDEQNIAECFIEALRISVTDESDYSWKRYLFRSHLYSREKYSQTSNLANNEITIIFFPENSQLKAQIIYKNKPKKIIIFDEKNIFDSNTIGDLKYTVRTGSFTRIEKTYSDIWSVIDKEIDNNIKKVYIYSPPCIFRQDFYGVRHNDQYLIEKYDIIHLL